MNYLYITLFYFYTKVLRVQYPPIISISAVLSILIVLFLMILMEYFNLRDLYNYSHYLKYIFIIIYFLGWFLLYNWYLPKEKDLLLKFKMKATLAQAIIIAISSFLTIFLIFIWFKRFDIFR